MNLEERLRAHVEMLAGTIGPRHPGRTGTMAATAAYVRDQMAAMGYDPKEEQYDASGTPVVNVVADVPGRRDGIVLLGAHYDTVETTPGADDNASAVAVLLESMRLLQGVTFRHPVRFVSFACEEPPFFWTQEMGSQIHARGCRERGESIRGMICLEMVGYFTPDEPPRYPDSIPRFFARAVLPRRGDFLAAVGDLRSWRTVLGFRRGFKRATRLPLVSICLPRRVKEISLSDNVSFWNEGFPALMLTDTSFFRNPNYHKPTDTPDTLDYARMADATLGVAGGIRRLARG